MTSDLHATGPRRPDEPDRSMADSLGNAAMASSASTVASGALPMSASEIPAMGSPSSARAGVPNMIAHVVTFTLMFLSFVIGLGFWRDWFSSVDRLVCTVFVFLGLAIALYRCFWGSDQPARRVGPIAFWSFAAVILVFSTVSGRPKLAGIAMGMAAIGWFCHQIRGESHSNAIALGLAFMIPSLVDACKDRGAFDATESVAVDVTSGLADALLQSHLRVGNTIQFGHGVADKFSCEGNWDSIVTFMGISMFCIYAYRRNLINGLITFSLSFIVWMGLRGAAWVTLSTMATFQEEWVAWTVGLEIFLFIIGAIFIVSLDQFFAMLLQPIPAEFINPDFPLVATCWNWIVGLPKLTTAVPVRDFQADEIEEDY
ncbi:MAG: hypothetical protein MUD03_16155 [Pirellula sp.]|nr:hypothetical protein [Pirellula sp.]